MQKIAQSWLAGEPNSTEQQKPTSLLAEWNSYAASRSVDDEGSSAFGFDLEGAVRTANETVSGTFNVKYEAFSNFAGYMRCFFSNFGQHSPTEIAQWHWISKEAAICLLYLVVSKGVRDLPGSIQSATSAVPSGKSLMYFGLFLATGVFFIFIAFTMFLPVMVLMPQKFALCFTLGCLFIIGAFFAIKGPKNQLAHMTSKERIPFTLGFIGSMVGTIYVSMVLHSYILSVLFSVLQVLALAYYVLSYFPGGSAGLKFLSSTLLASILKCFGR